MRRQGAAIRRVLLILIACGGIAVVTGVLSAGPACAHDPRFACSPRSERNPIAISNSTKSWAFYGRLAAGQEDRYLGKVAEAEAIPASILVDVRDAANGGRPQALFYDGSGKMLARLDLSHPQPFYEPFSHVHYLSSPERLVHIPPGQFAIVIAMRGGVAPQRYTFAFGRDERFGLIEVPYLVGAIYRIHARKY